MFDIQSTIIETVKEKDGGIAWEKAIGWKRISQEEANRSDPGKQERTCQWQRRLGDVWTQGSNRCYSEQIPNSNWSSGGNGRSLGTQEENPAIKCCVLLLFKLNREQKQSKEALEDRCGNSVFYGPYPNQSCVILSSMVKAQRQDNNN